MSFRLLVALWTKFNNDEVLFYKDEHFSAFIRLQKSTTSEKTEFNDYTTTKHMEATSYDAFMFVNSASCLYTIIAYWYMYTLNIWTDLTGYFKSNSFKCRGCWKTTQLSADGLRPCFASRVCLCICEFMCLFVSECVFYWTH